jgi:hypothetical protein
MRYEWSLLGLLAIDVLAHLIWMWTARRELEPIILRAGPPPRLYSERLHLERSAVANELEDLAKHFDEMAELARKDCPNTEEGYEYAASTMRLRASRWWRR